MTNTSTNNLLNYAKQLKTSILQQAIQGKLVEQRKEEGTAKELLEEIRKEKQKLIKEGKIKQNKKDKKLKPITEEEISFDIPKSWEWVRLGEICNLENGEKYEEKELLPYLDAKYLRTKLNPKMVNIGEYIKENEYVILVDGENSGEYFKIFCNGIMGSTFKKLIINNNLYIEYIFLILKLNKELFKKNKKGSAIPHLNKDIFYNLLFPLPPLLEQKRIVEKIEEIFKRIDIIEREQKNLKIFKKALKNSILQQAIQGKLVEQRKEEGTAKELLEEIKKEKQELIKQGKIKKTKKDKKLKPIKKDEIPFDIPKSWEWVRLGEIGKYKKGPFGSSLVKTLFVEKGENTIKVYEQKNAIYKNEKLGNYYITKEYFENKMKSFEVFPNDIIVSCAGTIGEIFIMPKIIEKGIINQALMKITLLDYIYKKYFILYFDYFIKETSIKCSSQGTAIKNIPPFEIFKNLLFPLPPLLEQKRIAEKIEKIFEKIDI